MHTRRLYLKQLYQILSRILCYHRHQNSFPTRLERKPRNANLQYFDTPVLALALGDFLAFDFDSQQLCGFIDSLAMENSLKQSGKLSKIFQVALSEYQPPN